NEAQQQVVIRGRLRTWVNTVETSNAAKAYRVQFRYGGGVCG
ncbi:type IV conjugative transfer system protein TraE, partial [Xanthomonas hortorum pv. hederae]